MNDFPKSNPQKTISMLEMRSGQAVELPRELVDALSHQGGAALKSAYKKQLEALAERIRQQQRSGLSPVRYQEGERLSVAVTQAGLILNELPTPEPSESIRTMPSHIWGLE